MVSNPGEIETVSGIRGEKQDRGKPCMLGTLFQRGAGVGRVGIGPVHDRVASPSPEQDVFTLRDIITGKEVSN